MKIRRAALAVCAIASTFAIASCSLPGVGGASDEPESAPTVIATQSSPDPSQSATAPGEASPSPTASAAPSAAIPGMTTMKRPTKPYPDPKFPKGPSESRPATERLLYELEKKVWTAAGEADAKKTSGKCSVSAAKLNKAGTHNFVCTVVYDGVSSPFKVAYKTGSFISTYRYSSDYLPLTRKKAEYSAMYSAYNSVGVACEMKTETVRVQTGDEQAVLCHVQNKDGDVDDYYLEMSQYGSVYGSQA